MKNANVDYTLKVRERERAQCIIRVVMFFTFCPCKCFIVVEKGHVTSNNIATIIYSLKKKSILNSHPLCITIFPTKITLHFCSGINEAKK